MLGNIVFYNMIKFCISYVWKLTKASRPWSVTRLWIVERETFNILAMRVQVNPSPLNSSKLAGGISKDGLPRPLLLQEGLPRSTALVVLLSVSALSLKLLPPVSMNFAETLTKLKKQRLSFNINSIFIWIDLLQHLEISRHTYPTNLSKISVTTLTVMLIFPKKCALYIPLWLVHFSLNLSHLLNVKHWRYSHWNVLVMDICIVRINLEKLA